MLGRYGIGSGALALLLAIAAMAASPAGAPSPSRRATLLSSHGEPRLAWEALRAGGPARTDADDALAVRLLTELGRYAEAESLLARNAAPKGDRDAAWYYLRRGRLSLEADRADRALELLAATSLPADDPLASYLEYVRGRAYAKKGNAASAASALDAARTSAPEALAFAIDEERVVVLRTLGRSADAMTAVEDGIAHATDGPDRRRLLATRYDVAMEAGDDAAAAKAALALLEDHPTYPEAEACALDVTRPLQKLGSADGISTRLMFACAEVFAARNRPDDLRRVLRALDGRSLQGADAEHHRLLWGEYHFETADFARAIALARPSYSDSTYKRRSTILLARSLRATGRKVDAATIYEQFATTFPNDAMAADALYAAASLREQAGQNAESARLLDQVRRAYPSSFHGWAAAMRRAHEFEKEGDVDEAAAIFEQWLARSRRTDEAALFYLSRLYETREEDNAALLIDELRRVNPYSFYVTPDVGSRARVPLRDATGTVTHEGAGALSSWLADAAGRRERAYVQVVEAAKGKGNVAEPDAVASAALARGRMFLEAGFRDWGERELEIVRRRPGMSPDVALELAHLYESYAMPWRSVRVFERARVGLPWETRRELADEFRYLMYPLPYPAQVFDAAAQNEIPAHLIYAIMREESRFERDVVSRAGAVGLMQLMPETARRAARTMELGTDVDGRLDDPSVNVAIGSWYASSLLRKGGGSVAWMLAAYNAGPGAAERWLTPGISGDDAITAVESIDYRETRGYVKRVVESANVYHALYFGDSSPKNAPR